MNKDVMGVQEVSPGYEFVAENPAVPVGYKQTEVGVIPEDWEVALLGDCLATRPGYGINAAAVPYSDKLPTYIRITDISEEGRFKPSPAVSVRSELAKHYYLSANDIVFARTGASVGKSYLYRSDDGPLVYAGFLIRVTPDQLKLNSGFLAAYVTTGHYWQWVRLMSMRSGQPGINGAEYSQLPVPLPSLDEQHAITTALSDVDALLEELDRLIAKKRDIKQAAMQQLLTGETRLPGFEGEWIPVKFSSLATLSNARIDPSRSEGSDFCIELEHINQGTGLLNGSTVTTETSSLKTAFEPGDVLFGKLRAYLRKYWIANRPGVCSTEIWVLKANSQLVLPQYLFQMVATDSFIESASTAYGTHMPRSDWKVIRETQWSIPCINEQQAIAAVLSDMDTEIQALEQRRSKTAKLKQGMMQELLTGRTRLV